MKRRGLLLVVAAGLLVGADAKEDLKKEKEMLKGTWSVTAFEVPKGQKEPSEKELKGMKLIATEDKLRAIFGDEDNPASYKLDPSKKPREIDIMLDGGKTLKGIYSLDGDTLKICVAEKGDRPKEFKADAETKAAVMTFKRDKK
jgi:uncharacterized protein (TIGR03067 family)